MIQKIKKIFFIGFLFSNFTSVFSQVTVIVKCDNKFVDRVYRSYEECGCKEWAYDIYYVNSDMVWGHSRSDTRAGLEAKWEDWNKAHPGATAVGGQVDAKRRSQIYCFDKSLCSQSSSSSIFNSDLFNKVNKSIGELREKLTQLKQAYDDFPIVKRADAGLLGYMKFIDRASDAAMVAYQKALAYQKQPLVELERELKSIENALNMDYMDASSKLVHINSYNIKKSEEKYTENSRKQYNYQSEEEIRKQKQKEQLDVELDNLAIERKELNKKLEGDISNAINSTAEMLINQSKERQQNYQKQQELENEREAREEERREKDRIKEEEERRQRAIQREEDARLQRELYREMRIEAEKERQIRAEKINEWKEKSFNIINTGELLTKTSFNKPSEISNSSIKSVYYVIWNFTKYNEIAISQLIEIKKSPDGDWILNADLKRKIEEESKLKISTTLDGISTAENELSYLLGYFETQAEANKARTSIIESAKKSGNGVIENQNVSEKTNNKDFWDEKNNPNKKTKETPTKTESKDFWEE